MKFEVGEIAISACKKHIPRGEEVSVRAVGPWPKGTEMIVDGRSGCIWGSPSDYVVDYRGRLWVVDESDLRKRRPPVPEEVRRMFDGRPVSEPA